MCPNKPSVPLSLVLITHERHDLFIKAYASILAARNNYSGCVEVLVVNSSVQSLKYKIHTDHREIHVPTLATAADKREIGWKLSNNDWIVFMDDDCELNPNSFHIIAEHVLSADNQVGAFFGVTEFVGPKSFWFSVVENTEYQEDFSIAKYEKELFWGPTSIAIFSKYALSAVGGFDTDIGILAGGEDVDICLRLREGGWRLRAIPETLVYHTTHTWNSASANFRRSYNYGQAEMQLQRRWPQYSIRDNQSPLLFFFVWLVLLAGFYFVPAYFRIAFYMWIIYPLFWLIGEAFCKYLDFRKRTIPTLCLTLLLVVYKVGLIRQGIALREFRFLIRRLDWQYMKHLDSSRGIIFGRSFFIRWGMTLLYVLLFYSILLSFLKQE